MAQIPVTFTREQSAGMTSFIYVNNERLPFTNDKAGPVNLTVGEEFEVFWRVKGPLFSTLTIKYDAGAGSKNVVENFRLLIKSRNSSFTFIKLAWKG